MYAVIFTARMAVADAEYATTAQRLRQRALEEFGCVEFVANHEAGQEIAISYWRSLADIERWRADVEHQHAQSRGRTHWYSEYQVKVVEVLRAYENQRDGTT